METRTDLHIHFLHRNVRDTVIVMKEVNLPHPWCPSCDMLLLWVVLIDSQPSTKQCEKGVKQKWHIMATDKIQDSTERDYIAYGRPLNSVP